MNARESGVMNCKSGSDIEDELQQYEPYITRVAADLTRDDWVNMCDDVEQEMRIAVWQNSGKHPALMKRIMWCRAIDFLKSYTKFYQTDRYGVKLLSYEAIKNIGLPAAVQLPHGKRVTDKVFAQQILLELPAQMRDVIQKYYLDGMNLAEIGEDRGLHYTRISQIKSEALERLRRA